MVVSAGKEAELAQLGSLGALHQGGEEVAGLGDVHPAEVHDAAAELFGRIAGVEENVGDFLVLIKHHCLEALALGREARGLGLIAVQLGVARAVERSVASPRVDGRLVT